MGRWGVCGNDQDKTLEVVVPGERHVFDTFGCAIARMAPISRTAAAR